MSAAKLSQCRWCQADIWWLNHITTGRAAAVDVGVSTNGAVQVDLETAKWWTVAEGQQPMFGTVELHTLHRVTCTKKRAYQQGIWEG